MYEYFEMNVGSAPHLCLRIDGGELTLVLGDQTPALCRNSKCSRPLSQLYPSTFDIWNSFSRLTRHDPFSHTFLILLSQILLNVTNAYIQVSMDHMVSLDIWLTQFRNLQNQILIKYDLDYFSTVTTRNVEDSQGRPLGFYLFTSLYQVFKFSLWFYYSC